MPAVQVDHPVLFRLHRLSRSLLRTSMVYYLHEFGLGVPQVQILHAVGGRGPLASKEIADALAMNPALVSRTLRELTELGYVVGTGDSQDARLRIWSLTEAGFKFVRDARPLRLERQRKFLAPLTKAEQLLLVDVLDKLYVSSEALRAEEALLIRKQRGSLPTTNADEA